MQLIPQSIPEVILIQPTVHSDSRGYFVETFRQDLLEKLTENKIDFCQDNESKSNKGVLRGLHFQKPPFAQSKLVRVISGEVLDIAVDIRVGSPSFGKHVAVILNDKNKHQLFIPQGFAHGYVVLSQSAICAYKVDQYYASDHELGIAYNDPKLAINWLLPNKNLILSAKDLNQPLLKDIETGFVY